MDKCWKHHAKWTQKTTFYMIPFIWKVQKRQIHRDGKEIRLPGSGERGMDCDCYWVQGSFLKWWICSEIRSWRWLHNLVHTRKPTEMYTLKKLGSLFIEPKSNQWGHILTGVEGRKQSPWLGVSEECPHLQLYNTGQGPALSQAPRSDLIDFTPGWFWIWV